jgi:hypothetical protein
MAGTDAKGAEIDLSRIIAQTAGMAGAGTKEAGMRRGDWGAIDQSGYLRQNKRCSIFIQARKPLEIAFQIARGGISKRKSARNRQRDLQYGKRR